MHAWVLWQGALWTREAEKQQQLHEIRREREELQLKEREEAQKLLQLNESFKQRVGAHDGLTKFHCMSWLPVLTRFKSCVLGRSSAFAKERCRRIRIRCNKPVF